MSIIENIEEDLHAEAFRLSATLAMRMKMGGIRPYNIQSAVHTVSRKIREEENPLEYLEEYVKNEAPEDEEIVQKMISNSETLRGEWRFRTLLKLASLEEDRRGPLSLNRDELDIEHIAPRKTFTDGRYGSWRDSIDRNSFDEDKNSIGNLTILHKSDHSKINETSFEKKKRGYANSDIIITEEISDKDKWGTKQINQRAEQIARQLANKWSV
jgi:hypothetical protein